MEIALRKWVFVGLLPLMLGCFAGGAPVRAEESSDPGMDVVEGAARAATPGDTKPELIVTGRPASSPTGAGDRSSLGTSNRPGLDALLQLPSGYLGNGGARPVAGASESEWRRRFRKADTELQEAQRALQKTKVELDGVAEEGGANQWAVAPPGSSSSGNSSSPLSFKLRQALVRDRERVEGAERALRELRIEADLAGVPATWRSERGAVTGGGASIPRSAAPN
ncbi:MAG: hypothetical protein AB8G23_22935 [Myxococcota bacterium]